MSPNQATTLGLIAGLAAAACIALGEQLLGAGLFFFYYLFDYCDGELARLHNLSSRFGAYYDDFVDWIVHATFFLALGYQTTVEAGMVVWVWLGAAAAFGSTISAALPLVLGGVPEGEAQIATLSDLGKEARPIDVVIFAFRGLARADFWLIVLGLAIAGGLWVLLPAAAIGSQVFWLLYFKKIHAKNSHVSSEPKIRLLEEARWHNSLWGRCESHVFKSEPASYPQNHLKVGRRR